jgi:hypothetical protein
MNDGWAALGARVKELQDVYRLNGLISPGEVDCLYQLGQFNGCDGAIVEIGSWKGKSTITLAAVPPLGLRAIYIAARKSRVPRPEWSDENSSAGPRPKRGGPAGNALRSLWIHHGFSNAQTMQRLSQRQSPCRLIQTIF